MGGVCGSIQLRGLRSESCLQPIGGLEEEPGTQYRMTQDGCHGETVSAAPFPRVLLTV